MERPQGGVPVDGPQRAPRRQQRLLWAHEPSWGQACQALRCCQRQLTVDGPSARCGMMLKTGWRAARPGQCLPPAAPSWENPQDSHQPSRHPGKKASSRPTASGWVPRGPQWLLLLGETAPGRASVGASGYVSKSPTSGLSPCPCQLLPQHRPARPTAAQTQGGGANTGWPGPQFEIAATKPLFCLQCSPAHLAPSGCLDPVFKRLCREPEPSRSPAETQVHGRACVHTPPAPQEATAGHPRLQSSPAPTRASPPPRPAQPPHLRLLSPSPTHSVA